MSVLSVVFKAVDQLSGGFEAMASKGEAAVESFQRAGEAADVAIGRAASSADGTAQSLGGVASSTDHWTSAVGNYNKEAMEAIYSTEELVDMGFKSEDALGDVATAADGAADSMEDYGEEAETAGEQAEEAGEKGADGIKTLQGLLASAGIIAGLKKIGEGFMECSEAASEFETSTAKVATIADTGQKSLADISSEIKQYSNETGQAATDMAEATYQAISAGVNTADAAAFAGTATKLAIGGFTQSATAVDVLTTAINAYNMQADDATYVSDILITTQNLGKTSVDLLAQSVGKVIPLASAYNMKMDQLGTTMAVMTANGIATAEATTYTKSILAELGDTGSTVAGILQDETGQSFAQLMDSGYSLGDVLEIIGDSVGGDTTAFSNLWSSTEAGVGALSLFNSGADRFNAVLSEMQSSAGATEKAYSTMADTTEGSKNRMTTAFNNLKISVGEKLNPALSSVYDGFAKIFSSMASFVDEHPSVVSAITGVATALGVAAGAFAAYNLVTAGAELATKLFTAALDVNPIFLAVTAIAALTAGIATFVATMQESEYDGMTAVCKDQYDALQDLNAEYDTAVEKYGVNSSQAETLRGKIELLTDEFNDNRQSVEDFVAETEALVESHNKIAQAYSDTTTAIDDNYNGTMGLVKQLEILATQNDTTAVSEQRMQAIIQRLNQDVPGLALSYEQVTTNAKASVEAIKAAAEAQAEQQRQTAQMQTYADLVTEHQALVDQQAAAEANLAAERERLNMTYDESIGWHNAWITEGGYMANWTTDLDEYKQAVDEASAALAENEAMTAEIVGEWEDVATAAEEAANSPATYEEAVSIAMQGVQEELEGLITEYNDAYEAAYNSISGQVGLFEEMNTSCEMSVSDMMSNMESQATAISTYAENLQKAGQYGLSEGLIQSLSDGSVESAGYIAEIISNIESLGGSTEGMSSEATAFVDEFNGKFAEVETAKEDFATTVATMSTDFNTRMAEIEAKMQETVAGMEMSSEASAAATATISAYAQAIRDQQKTVTDAATAVAQAAAQALASVSLSLPSISVGGGGVGHAAGTTFARENAYIAGENGPELILDGYGSEVFPASETDRLISALTVTSAGFTGPEDFQDDDGTGTGDRKIIISIEGRGSIQVDGGGADQEAMLDFLMENLRPALTELLTQEVMEEGDDSYEY